MTPIRRNVIANYAGTFWMALMNVIFIPVYIKFMGIEAYGLVGIFASLMALFAVLDLGLSATMTREMARLAATDPSGREARSLSRTLEIIYWAIALVLGVAVVLLAGPIADYWVKPDRLEPATVKQALMVTGAVIALRWPVAFYAGGLRGLDRQPLLNVIQSTAATLRGLGAVAVLWLISPTVQAFFLWQIIVSFFETSWLTVALWRSLPGRGTSVRFSLESLEKVWRFSAGMTGISVVSVLLTQTDKIILSKMLPLDMFGYYMLAWTVSFTLLRIVAPIDAAVYPTMNRLVALKSESELSHLYHKSSQIEVMLLAPAALVLILFGDAVLAVWSGDPAIVQNAGPILRVLAIGTCLNGFMHMPYLAQLAHGWTSLTFYQNVVSVVVLVPLMILLTQSFEGIGAAWVWVILNTGYVLIPIQIMHRRILKREKWNWYIHDVGVPSSVALLVALVGRSIMPEDIPIPLMGAYVVTIAGLAFLAAALATEFPRAKLFEAVRLLQKGNSAHKPIG